MSDILADLERVWGVQISFVLPVAGALLLVVVLYVCSVGAVPSPPTLTLSDSPSTKKERANAKKRAKQQEKVSTSVLISKL